MSSKSAEVLLADCDLASATVPRPRLILAVDGLDKEGKTNFAFTAPKPLVYLDLDIGKEGVVHKFPHPYIIASRPFIFRPTEALFLDGKVKKDAATIAIELAEPELERFKQTYYRALREPVVKTPDGRKLRAKTVVIDTGTEAWEMLRLAELGKLSQVKPHHYTAVNAMMRDFVRAGFDSDVNVIWLHKLAAEWKDGVGDGKANKTGTLQRAGFKDMSFLVQANLLAYRARKFGTTTQTRKWKSGEGLIEVEVPARDETDDLGFRLTIGNCRHDPNLEGVTLYNEQVDFKIVASMMLPQTTEADWADAE